MVSSVALFPFPSHLIEEDIRRVPENDPGQRRSSPKGGPGTQDARRASSISMTSTPLSSVHTQDASKSRPDLAQDKEFFEAQVHLTEASA